MADRPDKAGKSRDTKDAKRLYLSAFEPSLPRPAGFDVRPILWNIQSDTVETRIRGLSDALKNVSCLSDEEVVELWSVAKTGILNDNPVLVRYFGFEILKSICLRPNSNSSMILGLLQDVGDPGDEMHRHQLEPIDLFNIDPRDLGQPEDEQLRNFSLLPLLQRVLLIVYLEITCADISEKETSEENFHSLWEYLTNYVAMFNDELFATDLESITLSIIEIGKKTKSPRHLKSIIKFLDHLYPKSLESPTILNAILLALSVFRRRFAHLLEPSMGTLRRYTLKRSAQVETHLLTIMSESVENVDHESVAGAVELYCLLLAESESPLAQSISLPKIVAMMDSVTAQRHQTVIDCRLLRLCNCLMNQRHLQQVKSEDWSGWVRIIMLLIERCQGDVFDTKDDHSVHDDIVESFLRFRKAGRRPTASGVSAEVSAASDLLNPVLDFYSALQNLSQQKSWADLGAARQSLMLKTFVVLDHRLFTKNFCHNLVRSLLRSLSDSAEASLIALDRLMAIAKSSLCTTETRLIALKLLLRIRCDSSSALWILPGSESENLAASLGRTEKSAETFRMQQDRARDFVATEFPLSTPPKGSAPPKWMYGGPKGLPEDPPPAPSPVTFSSSTNTPTGENIFSTKIWLELLIGRLQNEEDWEIYSYVLVHLGAQLMNVTLFEASELQIKFLRRTLVDQIVDSTYRDPPAGTGLKKSDVAICIFNILTSLVAYHRIFDSREQDGLIQSFYTGIGTLDGTSKGCLQALSICCVEIPSLVTSNLDAILDRISKIVTQSALAMHVLEFLVNLARLSDIYYNFGDEDIRKLFGICFKYLEIAREDKERRRQPARPKSIGPSSSLSRVPALDDTEASLRKSPEPANELPQYILALTYHVMIHWYLAIKVADRSRHSSFILRRLMHKDADDKEIFEEQTRVFVDMMQRTCGSDLGETDYPENFFEESDGAIAREAWMVGICLVMIETGSHSGRSIMTKRYPTSTSHVIFTPNPRPLPRHHITIRAPVLPESAGTSSQVKVTAVHTFLLSSTLNSPVPGVSLSAQPMRLDLHDSSVKRAISMFDMNNTVDGHRVGVICLRPGTLTEQQILSNTMVSNDFLDFLNGLGTLCPFEGTYFKTQGFDETTDGAATYAWRDRISEMIFHVPSMMPTNMESDPCCNNKKRHVGNDHIKVFFNESGQDVRSDIIASQFNSVNIMVTPATRQSAAHATERKLVDHLSIVESHLRRIGEHSSVNRDPAETKPSSTSERITTFKVQTLTAPHLARLSPFSSPKVISAEALPDLIRFTTLNASLYSTVARHVRDNPSPSEPYPSPWRERYRALVKLRNQISKELTLASKPPDRPKSPPRSSLGALFRSNTRTPQKTSGPSRGDRKTWWYEGKNPRERPDVDHETAAPGPNETMLDWVDFGTYTAD